MANLVKFLKDVLVIAVRTLRASRYLCYTIYYVKSLV